jgi:hypothetical protein
VSTPLPSAGIDVGDVEPANGTVVVVDDDVVTSVVVVVVVVSAASSSSSSSSASSVRACATSCRGAATCRPSRGS